MSTLVTHIHIEQSLLDAINRDPSNKKGILIGHYQINKKTGTYIVYIDYAIDIIDFFDLDSITDKEVVGWYHIHTGEGIFLSSIDLHTYREYFNQKWSVALVVDPRLNEFGFFAWSDKGDNIISIPKTQVKVHKTIFSHGFYLPQVGKPNLIISITHPKFLSKRYASPFLVQIYLPKLRREAIDKMKKKIGERELLEHVYFNDLEVGRTIILRLSSPEILFSEVVVKKLETSIAIGNFLARPLDNCHTGNHYVIFSVLDKNTELELVSETFVVQITDFVFDHVSRPFLSKIITTILGVGSLTMFIFTLLGQIDTTLGIASGTTAGILASTVYARFSYLYQQMNPTNHP